MAKPSFKQESTTTQCAVDGCSRGARNKGICGKHYQRMRTYGQYELPQRVVPEWRTCSLDGCDNWARSRQARHCETHYYRMRRRGTYDAPVYMHWTTNGSGYIMRRDIEHPIASRHGYLYQHRFVLYEAIGPGVHPCYWCGRLVDWELRRGDGKLVVDHLDGDKQNNVSSNLVPSCHRCNSGRGLFQKWVMEHRDDPFLWGLYEAAQRRAG